MLTASSGADLLLLGHSQWFNRSVLLDFIILDRLTELSLAELPLDLENPVQTED